VWDVVPSSEAIKRAFGTFASKGTYVAGARLLVFCACPFPAGVWRVACFLCTEKVVELEVSTSKRRLEFSKQFCGTIFGALEFWRFVIASLRCDSGWAVR
jgi:hypothetical protein